MTTDNWKSETHPINLVCGSLRITVVDEDGRPKKVFPSDLKMQKMCSQRLLAVIMELVAELCKSSQGYKSAIKILLGPNCALVSNPEKGVTMCTGEIAKILKLFEKKEE